MIDIAGLQQAGAPCEQARRRCDAVGTEPVEAAESLCKEAASKHPKTMFFAGQLIFEDEKWYHRLLHNNTAYAIQKKLQWDGLPMIILPVRLRDRG